MRFAHISKSPPNPSHFSVLVRSVPRSSNESLDDAIKNFFTNYHGLSYLSHQTIHRAGKVHKLMVRCLMLLVCIMCEVIYFFGKLCIATN